MLACLLICSDVQAKGYMRRKRGNAPFVVEIARAFAEVGSGNVRSFYKACISDL